MANITFILWKCILISKFNKVPINLGWIKIIIISFYLSISIVIGISYLYDIHILITTYLKEAMLGIILSSPFILWPTLFTQPMGMDNIDVNSSSNTSVSDISRTTSVSTMNTSGSSSNTANSAPAPNRTFDPVRSAIDENRRHPLIEGTKYHAISKTWSSIYQEHDPVLVREYWKYSIIRTNPNTQYVKIYKPIDNNALFDDNHETYFLKWLIDLKKDYDRDIRGIHSTCYDKNLRLSAVYCKYEEKEQMMNIAKRYDNNNTYLTPDNVPVGSLINKLRRGQLVNT